MQLDVVRAFVTAAQSTSVTAAAHRLSLTQPALSKQLARLEQQFGGPLLVRGRQGLTLTELGRAVLPAASDLLTRADDLERYAQQHAAGRTGWLRVGFGLSSLQSAPAAVAAFRRTHPDVKTTLDDLPSAEQVRRLRTGELDVGFVRLDRYPDLAGHRTGRDRLALATSGERPPQHALGRWLHDRPLIRLRRVRGPGLAAQIDAVFQHYGVDQVVQQEADDLLTVLALVAAGVGEALVPASTASIADPRVALYPVRGTAAVWRTGVVWSPDHATAAVHEFVRTALSAIPRPSSR